MTGEPTIDYDALALEAMRGLVRTVLTRTARTGLPGDHHFYISFSTEAPGVMLSKRLKERYPREMTIVLQHRFWDLVVTDDRFEVKLTFDSIPERLVVPFPAIKVFFDPSVQYGLRFEDGEPGDATEPAHSPQGTIGSRTVSQRATSKRPRTAKRPKSDLMAVAPSTPPSAPVPLARNAPALVPVPAQPVPAGATASAGPAPASSNGNAAPTAGGEGQERAPGSAQILSLDQFRKK